MASITCAVHYQVRRFLAGLAPEAKACARFHGQSGDHQALTCEPQPQDCLQSGAECQSGWRKHPCFVIYHVSTWTILSLAHLQGTSRKQHSDQCKFNSVRIDHDILFLLQQSKNICDSSNEHSCRLCACDLQGRSEPVGQCIIPVFSPSSLIHKVAWCFPSWVTLEVCFILTLYEDMSFFSLQLSGSECPHRGLHSYCVISFGLLFISFFTLFKKGQSIAQTQMSPSDAP